MAIDERELDDSVLVEAAQSGDHDAFAELFRRHYPSVRRSCARRLGSATEADEVAQAAFVRAFERIHQCEGERRFGAWVQVIAYNLGADARRHSARSRPAADPVTGDAALGPNHCEDHVLRAERVAEVRELLDTLPPRQREVIVARDMEGRRPGEIAASLGLTLGAVDSLLLRARRRMAMVWESRGPELGTTSIQTTTASLISGATAVAHRPVLRGLSAAGRVLQAASYRIATSVGVVPGASLPARVGAAVGGAVVAGTLVTMPAAVSTPHVALAPPTALVAPAPNISNTVVAPLARIAPALDTARPLITTVPAVVTQIGQRTAQPAPVVPRATVQHSEKSLDSTVTDALHLVAGLLRMTGLAR